MNTKTTPYHVTSHGMTDVGLVRQKNEDAWAELPQQQLFLLADGMGGHQSGDVAAKEAIKALEKLAAEPLSPKAEKKLTLDETRTFLKKSIEEVNTQVFNLGYSDEELRGMGTTLCALHVHDDGVVYAHVGDSRIYRLRDEELEQVTRDHSLLRELVDLGQLDEEQSIEFLYKNILTRAVGTEPVVEPTVNTAEIQPGDLYLLCSDGLTDMLTDDIIEEIMIREKNLKISSQALVKAAKEQGGNDNITVVLVKIEKADLSG